MKHLIKKTLTILLMMVLTLTFMFGTTETGLATGTTAFHITDYQVTNYSYGAYQMSGVYGSNIVNIDVNIWSPSGDIGELTGYRGIDSFDSTKNTDIVCENIGNGLYTIHLKGLMYSGKGNDLIFTLSSPDNGYETLSLAITECVETTAPVESSISEPRAIFSSKPLSSPIKTNESATIEVEIKNAGNTPMMNPIVSFETSESLMITGNQNTFQLPTIYTNSSEKINIPVKALSGISSQYQYINANLEFEYYNSTSYASTSTSIQSGKISVLATPSEDHSGIDSAVPTVILTGYSYGGESIAAGEEANLALTFLNTSKDLDIENITVTVTGGANLSLNGTTNTFYFEKVAKGKSKSFNVPLKAAQTLSSNIQDIDVSFHYEYVDNGRRLSNGQNVIVSIPVYQPDRFEVSQPMTYYEATVGWDTSLGLSYVNKGTSPIMNAEVFVNGDVTTYADSQRIGTIEGGKSGMINIPIVPNSLGESIVTITLSYEDANGTLRERVFEATVNSSEYIDPYIPEDEPPIEEETKKFPWWIPIAVVLVGGIVALVIVKSKKKKAKKAAEQALWDSWDEEETK